MQERLRRSFQNAQKCLITKNMHHKEVKEADRVVDKKEAKKDKRSIIKERRSQENKLQPKRRSVQQ